MRQFRFSYPGLPPALPLDLQVILLQVFTAQMRKLDIFQVNVLQARSGQLLLSLLVCPRHSKHRVPFMKLLRRVSHSLLKHLVHASGPQKFYTCLLIYAINPSQAQDVYLSKYQNDSVVLSESHSLAYFKWTTHRHFSLVLCSAALLNNYRTVKLRLQRQQ